MSGIGGELVMEHEPSSGIYRGTVFHSRLSPKQHSFSYRVFMLFVDLNRIDELFSRTRFWSCRLPNLAWLRRRDFIGPHHLSIEQAVKQRILQETGAEFAGKVFMLANLRYFGFIINPLTCYYCYDEKNQLCYIVAEVTNTPWRERYSYVLQCDPNSDWQRKELKKAMHVSPFNEMNMVYRWRSNAPGKLLNIAIDAARESKCIFNAQLNLELQPIKAGFLDRLILIYPFMTLKVAAAIYWQALRLYLKGVPFVSHPPKSTRP